MGTKTAPNPLKGERLRLKIRNERGWAMRRILGQNPWHKQLEIEKAVFDGPLKRTDVSGCVSSTKTYAAAMIALVWLMAYKPSRVFSLAPTGRQVTANIWGYMQTMWQAAKANGTPISDDRDIYTVPRIDLGRDATGKQLLDWGYTGFSTDDPKNVHGFHGPNDLVILDDAQGMSQALQDELENMMAGGNTRFLMLYNRTELAGPTFTCNHNEAAFWNHVGISYADIAEARSRGFDLPGALEASSVAFWAKKYGPTSNFFKVKVENKYPDQGSDTLIPLSWIEAAFNRKVEDKGFLMLGGDVAMEGDDASAKAPMRGMMVGQVTEWHEPDSMVTAGKFVADMKLEQFHENNQAPKSKAFAFIDAVGIGGPVANRMAEQDYRIAGHSPTCVGCQMRIVVEGLKGSESPVGDVMHGGKTIPAKDVFKNFRSQSWWNLRESLNPENADLIGLTRDDDLAAQLSCVKYRHGSDGLIEVEPKIGLSLKKGGSSNWGIKRRLGFSPDKADAVVNVVWGRARAIHGEFIAAGGGAAAHNDGSADYQTARSPGAGDHMDGVDTGGLTGADGGLDGVL